MGLSVQRIGPSADTVLPAGLPLLLVGGGCELRAVSLWMHSVLCHLPGGHEMFFSHLSYPHGDSHMCSCGIACYRQAAQVLTSPHSPGGPCPLIGSTGT